MVLEFPGVGAGLFGSIMDAWQIPLADVGPAGDDEGKGGKYLLLGRQELDAPGHRGRQRVSMGPRGASASKRPRPRSVDRHHPPPLPEP